MSSRASSARPQLRRDPPSSSPLDGMEKPWPSRPSTPGTPCIESIINMYLEKPLPPTPTSSKQPPSPLSSVTNLSPTFATNDKMNFTHGFKEASLKRSSASRIPDRLELRPHLTKGAPYSSAGESSTRPSLDSALYRGGPKSPQLRFQDIHPGTRVRTPDVSKEPHFTEWKAPVYRPPKKRNDSISPSPSKLSGAKTWGAFGGRPSNQTKWGVIEREPGSTSQAEEYRSLIHDVSPESPESKDNPFIIDSNYQPSPTSPMRWPDMASPSPMLPRISDVLDQPSMPEILHGNEAEDEGQSSDGCSSCMSEVGGLSRTIRRSFHIGMEQSFRRRPSSKYPTRGMCPGLEASTDDPSISIQRQHRKSLQQGVAEAYESLHRKISMSSKSKLKITHRDLGDSATTTKLDQDCGQNIQKTGNSSLELRTVRNRNGTDSSPSSITDKTRIQDLGTKNLAQGGSVQFSIPNRAHTDLSPKKERSMGRKLASAFHSGTAQVMRPEKSKSKIKRNQVDERREELRKKILVVLPERVEGARF